MQTDLSEAAIEAPPSVVAEPTARRRDVGRLAAGAGVALGGRFAGRGLLLLVDVTVARLLGPRDYGLYAIGWTVTRIVNLVALLGLNSGVIRFGARYWRQDDSRFKGVVLQSILGAGLTALVIGLVFFFGAPWISTTLFHKPELAAVLPWFAIGFPLAAIVTMAAATTRISQRIKFSVLTEDLGQPALGLVLILLLVALFKMGMNGVLAAYLISYSLTALLGLWFVAQLFPSVVSPRVSAHFPGKSLMAFSLPASLTGVLGVLVLWVNRLLVGHFRPAAEVGVYQAASQVPVTVALVVAAMGTIFSPMTADFAQRGEFGQVHELYKIGTKWTLYASIPPLLVMFFVPGEVITSLYGRSYASGAAPLMILALGQLLNAASGCVGTLLVMTGHQKITSALFAVMFFVSVVLGLYFIPRWGVIGAAWATTLTAAGVFVPALIIAWRLLRMQPYDRRYLKGLLATLLACGALLIPVPFLTSSFSRLLTAAGLAMSVFWITLLLAGLDPEDRHLITMLRTRLGLT
jgi:O-antigen/teichoic acid export membrane protein